MTMAVDPDDHNSEDDISPEAHNKLLDAVSKIYKKKRVEAPIRTEPTLEISEFHLTQPRTDKKSGKVKINDLVKLLNKRAKHDPLASKLKDSQAQAKTLQKPLEKPKAERVKRSVGYQNVKERLNRWEPIVYQQRVAEHVTFPLRQTEIKHQSSTDFLTTFRNPTEFEIQMAEVLKQSSTLEAKEKEEKDRDKQDEDNEYPLTLAEIIEQRQMMAKVRAQQSYRLAKAARQSKIKSKKFHRIQKRERIKNEIKEFEELQKKDPEAALKKLEQLEKTRAEERASLRHKSTGQWAKNLTVRAKYDKEARIALAEQLGKSRELTQKIQANKDSSEEESSESEEEKQDENKPIDPNNPWVDKPSVEVQEFYSGYRKYWEEKNKNKEENSLVKNKTKFQVEKTVVKAINNDVNCEIIKTPLSKEKKVAHRESVNVNKHIVDKSEKRKLPSKKVERIEVPTQEEVKLIKRQSGTWTVTPVKKCKSDNIENETKVNKKRKRKTKHKKTIKELIHEIENLEEKPTKKFKEKESFENCNNELTIDSEMEESESENVPSLEMKKTKLTADVDEQLDEIAGHVEVNQSYNLETVKKLAESSTVTETDKADMMDDIDPKKFLTVTPKFIKSQVPDLSMQDQLDDEEEEDSEEKRHLTISEAFADDDIVDEFRKEKEEEKKKSQVDNVDLSLPGWGSWGGPNLPTVSRRKKRRFIMKFPKPAPRRDEKKSNVIINEDKDLPIKEHRVSDVPFPFTSVKDYEASIRAPIGTNWIPQTAHRKMILPTVLTKMGTVIQPMDENVLVKKKELNGL